MKFDNPNSWQHRKYQTAVNRWLCAVLVPMFVLGFLFGQPGNFWSNLFWLMLLVEGVVAGASIWMCLRVAFPERYGRF